MLAGSSRLARAITLAGPISLAQFMGAANAHYYATRDPLGAAGDFTTALVPGAGQFPAMEAPAETSRLIVDFARRVTPA